MLRSSILRAAGSTPCLSTRQGVRALPTALNSSTQVQQSRNAHAISNPTLANIEKRWEAMPPQEQADLWMALRDRMKVDWNEMTMQEKKAGTLYSSPCIHTRPLESRGGLRIWVRLNNPAHGACGFRPTRGARNFLQGIRCIVNDMCRFVKVC